jgi:hypothetical protein
MVCQWFGHKTTKTVFSGLATKPVAIVFSGLALNPVAMVSPDLASKPVVQVSGFGPQNWLLQFGDLSLKITATVSWFGTQNQAGFGLSVVPQNKWREVGVGHADEDITPLDTNNNPPLNVQGPITRARAQ